jgi:streptogramin lyase
VECLENRCLLSVTITEFAAGISPNSGPNGITAGPDGNLWFTEASTNPKIGRITPSGIVTEFAAVISPESEPIGITAGPDGNLWFAEEPSKIGRITPLGVVTEFAMGISPNSEPNGITAGPDGNLWFTEASGNKIGRITPNGIVTEFGTGISPNSEPLGITAGPDGNLWFTEASANKIGRITPLGAVTEFATGITANSGPSGITAGPDGNLWFTEQDSRFGNRVGRITPNGIATEFAAGISPNSQPTGITAGPDGNLWFTEYAQVLGNKIGRITPSGSVTEFTAGITPGSGPLSITAGPDSNLWFTEYANLGGNRIGRLHNTIDTTGTTVSSSANPTVVGRAVILTATVTVTPPAGGTPTGTVTFLDGSTPLGAGTLSGNVAVFSTGAFGAGMHNITASYGGDPFFSGSTSLSLSLVVNPAATSLALASSANPSTAGQLITYTATVQATNSPATPTGYVTFFDGSTPLGASTLSGGLAVLSTTPLTAGAHNITAAYTPTPSFTGSSSPVPLVQQVNPAAASLFIVSGFPSPATAGSAGTFTVTAKDAYGNTATGYGGTVHFSSSDSQANLPANTGLTNGTGTLPATFKTAGTQALTATDTVTATITGTQTGIAVNPAAPDHLRFTASGSLLGGITAGQSFDVTVTVQDAFNNTVTAYLGTVHFTASNGATGSYTFTAADQGQHTFSVMLTQAGTVTVTGYDSVTPAVTGSITFTVNPGPANWINLTVPDTITAGEPFPITVTVRDAFNNPVTGYTGTVHFIATNGVAANYTFTPTDMGSHTFTVGVPTPQTLTITAADSVNPAITGNVTFTINPLPPAPGGGAAVGATPQSGAVAGNLTVTGPPVTLDGVWLDGATQEPANVESSTLSERVGNHIERGIKAKGPRSLLGP